MREAKCNEEFRWWAAVGGVQWVAGGFAVDFTQNSIEFF